MGGQALDISVLGPGCPNCEKLRELVREALADMSVGADVKHVTDIREIMKHVSATPALMVNGRVKHAGRPLPARDMVRKLIEEEML